MGQEEEKEKKEEVEKKDEGKEKLEQEVKEKKQHEENDQKQEDPDAAAADTIQEMVLKVDMHCEACARKVIRSLKGFQGVEEVKADYRASKVVVKLKENTSVDPVKVCQRVHKKSGRKVELISPLPKPPPDNLQTQQQQQEQAPKQDQENKQEPPAVTTLVLKVPMHCEACAQRLQKKIRKVEGVESVVTDISNNQVTVTGVLDPDKLVNDVYKKTHKHASIVKNEETKKEEKKDEAEKKDEKQEDKKQPEEEAKEDDDPATMDFKKIEYWTPNLYMGYYNYAPQMFSDENPNACSVM